jgi:hypothetical protein
MHVTPFSFHKLNNFLCFTIFHADKFYIKIVHAYKRSQVNFITCYHNIICLLPQAVTVLFFNTPPNIYKCIIKHYAHGGRGVRMRVDPEQLLVAKNRLGCFCIKLELNTSLNLVFELGSLWKDYWLSSSTRLELDTSLKSVF